MWSSEWTQFGIETTFVQSLKAEDVAGAIRENTRLVWLEVICE